MKRKTLNYCMQSKFFFFKQLHCNEIPVHHQNSSESHTQSLLLPTPNYWTSHCHPHPPYPTNTLCSGSAYGIRFVVLARDKYSIQKMVFLTLSVNTPILAECYTHGRSTNSAKSENYFFTEVKCKMFVSCIAYSQKPGLSG